MQAKGQDVRAVIELRRANVDLAKTFDDRFIKKAAGR